MSNEMTHHGILGMKWGVRRTPEQLGHKTGAKQKKAADTKEQVSQSTEKKKSNPKTDESIFLSDEELRARINRLNMEEQYRNLVARQKEASIGPAKKVLLRGLNALRDRSVDYVVSKLADRLFNKSESFDIDKFEDMDVYKMDPATLRAVSKWYQDAAAVTKLRQQVSHTEKDKNAGSPDAKKDKNAGSPDAKKSTTNPKSKSMDDVVRERKRAMRQLGAR